MTFSRFCSSFLSDLYCSHFEIKLVANIKSVVECRNQGQIAQLAVHMVMNREINGSIPGGVKCLSHACRSRAVIQTLVGLCSVPSKCYICCFITQ